MVDKTTAKKKSFLDRPVKDIFSFNVDKEIKYTANRSRGAADRILNGEKSFLNRGISTYGETKLIKKIKRMFKDPRERWGALLLLIFALVGLIYIPSVGGIFLTLLIVVFIIQLFNTSARD